MSSADIRCQGRTWGTLYLGRPTIRMWRLASWGVFHVWPSRRGWPPTIDPPLTCKFLLGVTTIFPKTICVESEDRAGQRLPFVKSPEFTWLDMTKVIQGFFIIVQCWHSCQYDRVTWQVSEKSTVMPSVYRFRNVVSLYFVSKKTHILNPTWFTHF